MVLKANDWFVTKKIFLLLFKILFTALERPIEYQKQQANGM